MIFHLVDVLEETCAPTYTCICLQDTGPGLLRSSFQGSQISETSFYFSMGRSTSDGLHEPWAQYLNVVDTWNCLPLLFIPLVLVAWSENVFQRCTLYIFSQFSNLSKGSFTLVEYPTLGADAGCS